MSVHPRADHRVSRFPEVVDTSTESGMTVPVSDAAVKKKKKTNGLCAEARLADVFMMSPITIMTYEFSREHAGIRDKVLVRLASLLVHSTRQFVGQR